MPGEFDPLCNPKPQSQKKTIKTATQLRKEGWDEAKTWKEGKFKLSVTSLTRASLPSPPLPHLVGGVSATVIFWG